MIGFAGIDPRRSEGGLVGRVGKFLGFERDAVAHAVEMAALADERAVEEVAGIDLHARLGRPQLEHAARFRILQPGGELDRKSTSELQSLMRNSYAVFCLKKKISQKPNNVRLNVRNNHNW